MTDPDRWLADRHEELVNDLTGELDLEAGLRDATLPGRHQEFVAEVADSLDLDRGLAAILDVTDEEPAPASRAADPVTVDELTRLLAGIHPARRLAVRPAVNAFATELLLVARGTPPARVVAEIGADQQAIAAGLRHAIWLALDPPHDDELRRSLDEAIRECELLTTVTADEEPARLADTLDGRLRRARYLAQRRSEEVGRRAFEVVTAAFADAPPPIRIRVEAYLEHGDFAALEELVRLSGPAGLPESLMAGLSQAMRDAGDLDALVTQVSRRARDLNSRFEPARSWARAVARARLNSAALARHLRMTAIGPVEDVTEAQVATLLRGNDDFVGADLEEADLTDVPLAGIRWSDGTRWPGHWRDRIREASVPVGDGIYVIRPGGTSQTPLPGAVVR
jgi:hypothetical protein